MPLPEISPIEPIAYLALEVKQRELHSRLQVASHLLRLGYPVVFGQQWSLFANAAALPPGLMVFKTINNIQAQNMARARAAGHLIAATDEEVLICTDDKCFMLGFSPVGAENCDLFLAQSSAHKESVLRTYPGFRGQIEVTGNPRIDLMSAGQKSAFEAKGAALRKEHGPYLLFNTNFSSINTMWGSLQRIAEICIKIGQLDPNDPKSVAEFHALIAWEQKNHAELTQLMSWAVQNCPNHKIVIRPHPTERKEYWEEQAAGNPRVLVVPRSDPHPWIMGADLVMHTSCTTGLEATLLNKPVINLYPSERPDFVPILGRINPTFATWQDAAAAAKTFLETGGGPVVANKEAFAATLAEYYPGYKDGAAARAVSEKLAGLLSTRGAPPKAGYVLQMRSPGFQTYQRSPELKDKFTVSAEEVAAAIRAEASLTGLSGQLHIKQLDDSLFFLQMT